MAATLQTPTNYLGDPWNSDTITNFLHVQSVSYSGTYFNITAPAGANFPEAGSATRYVIALPVIPDWTQTYHIKDFTSGIELTYNSGTPGVNQFRYAPSTSLRPDLIELHSGQAGHVIGFDYYGKGSIFHNTNTGMKFANIHADSTTGNVTIGSGANPGDLGTNMVAIGLNAGNVNASGSFGVMIGKHAGYAITSGSSNVLIGNDTGAALTTQSNNTIVGTSSNIASAENVIVGSSIGNATASGGKNTLIGRAAASGLTSGANNTIVGYSAGTNIQTGSNTVIGYQANVDAAARTNCIVIGQSCTSPAFDNTIAIGVGSGITSCYINGIRGVTTRSATGIAVLIDTNGQLGTVSSTGKVKKNVRDMKTYTDDIYKLRPVLFNYTKEYLGEEDTHDRPGLIMEEVEEIYPELSAGDSVKYQDLIPMLLNEIIKLNDRLNKLEGKK